jgi:hypothetical protein
MSQVTIEVYNYPFVDTYYHYYDEVKVRHAWYFRPRLFKSRAVLPRDVLEKMNEFVERKLAENLGQSYIRVETVFVTKVSNFEELRKLYEQLRRSISSIGGEAMIVMTFVKPEKRGVRTIYLDEPIVIPLSVEEFMKLFEEMMSYDVELNSETARKLFGKGFAEMVKQHNKEVRVRSALMK